MFADNSKRCVSQRFSLASRMNTVSHLTLCMPLQELTHLANSYTQLRQAQAKFRSCIENVGQVKPENKGVSSFILLSARGAASSY